MIIEDLDLRVLKGILFDKVNALTFVYKYDYDLFSDNVQKFAKATSDYIKTFRAPPTSKTLKENCKYLDINLIDDVFEQIESYQYNLNEYTFDVSKLKKRFQEKAVEEIKERVADDISEKPEEFVKKISLDIQRVVALDLERTYTQKTVAEFADEFLERYNQRGLNPEIQREIKTGFSMYDALTGGIAPAELIMWGGASNSGKALDISTPIPTPNGWTSMGELKAGDYVFGDDGKPTQVIAISGIMYTHDCFELTFSNGEKIIADTGHNWKVTKNNKTEIKTTKEIFKTFKANTYSINISQPLVLEQQNLLIDPYLLGVWLGGYNKHNISTVDCKKILTEYNLNENKRIPEIYLRSSIKQRISLMQGLMDSNGSVNKKSGCCSFIHTDKNIVDGVVEVLSSLGIKYKVSKQHSKRNHVELIECNDFYRVDFYTNYPMFRLANKNIYQKVEDKQSANTITIKNIKKVPNTPVQCIKVDNESHMFLAGKTMIPTHNSMALNAIGKNIWLQNNNINMQPGDFQRGYNVMYFSLEMPHEDCYVRFLASLANVDYRKLAKSQLSDEEKNRVDLASAFVKNYEKAGYYFDIIDVPRNLTIDELELRYHDALLKYRPDVVVVDYFGLMQASDAFKNEPDWLKLGSIAASLHEFGRAYDIAVITAGQLTDLKRSAQSTAAEESKAVGMHRWGRSSLIMHHVNVAVQIETRNNEKLYPDLKIHIVKNRKGPLGEGNLIKNFANASLIDVPFDENTIPGDISDNVQDLIKQLQLDSKEKEKA
jgi:replicative DNA helicase